MTSIPRGWLEPGRTDPEPGLRAEVADPVWFLARQWELGEFQGEDAGSPVAVALTPEQVPLAYDPDRPHLDPTVIPAEPLVEAEPGDWWTMGRRVRLGRAALPLLDPLTLDRYRFGALPVPYEALAGEIDGRAVFLNGILAGDRLWEDENVPSPPPDRFSTSTLAYEAGFSAGGIALDVRDHRGGDLDWFSVDVGDPRAAPAAEVEPPTACEVIPGRLTFPGAPHPRWWQIEDAAVDLGAFAPDRSHLGTMLLSDLAVANAEDWFVFPVPEGIPSSPEQSPPTSGVLARIGGTVTVRDAFGIEYPLRPPPAEGPGAWSLYAVPGLEPTDLVVWPVAVAPHAGPLLDDVLLGIDEDANLAWAAELRADGHEVLADASTDAAVAETTRTGTRAFRYQPMTTLPEHWHPYTRGVRWRQAVLADLNQPIPQPRPGPISRLIGGPSGTGIGRGHEIAPTAVPSSGVRLQRRARLARDTDGCPVLWVERVVLPIAGPPTSHLRWDVMVEAARTEASP